MNFSQNNLKNQSSPYLLQHANNPIHWQTWNENSLREAQQQNKLLVISIGYTACHWCHEMEKEVFEKQEVAHLMNEHFISIKVDREEHPDVDQIYMLALQIMTRQGGWPLNIVALPNGKPIWGATYLPEKQWLGSLHQLKDLYQKDPNQMEEYALQLEKGILSTQLIDEPIDTEFKRNHLQNALKKWQQNFDYKYGGDKGAPKFMMPNQLQFLLRYGFQENNKEVLNYVKLTLYKIAQGGIHDVVGGGFSRYSVDEKWHIPHFEKMLYDNAQLTSLYAQAYQVFKDEYFKEIATKTIAFIESDLKSDDDLYFASYDADSQNEKGEQEEGAFYTWTKKELQNLLKEDFLLFSDIFNINDTGYWENGKYVFIQTQNLQKVAQNYHLEEFHLKEKIDSCLLTLKEERNNRPQPLLDHKCLTSWNALTISSFIDTYKITANEKHLTFAVKTARALWDNLFDEKLYKSYVEGNKQILGTLEDYALVIKAYLQIYQITSENSWLEKSQKLIDIAFAEFYDEEENLFYLASKSNKQLFAHLFEVHDNVIPSSNAIMCHNLFMIGKITNQDYYIEIAMNMLHKYKNSFQETPSNYSEWMNTYLNISHPFYHLSFGKDCLTNKEFFLEEYLPNVILTPHTPVNLKQNDFRESDISNQMLLCQENSCKKPSNKSIEILNQIDFN